MSVFIVPTDEDVVEARRGIEDLAFDATAGLAQIARIEIASDEWQELYHELLAAYKNASRHLLYFLHLGITVVKMQLEIGNVRLAVPAAGETPTAIEVARAVIDVAKPVAACLLHVSAAGDKMLIPDEDIHAMEEGTMILGVGLTIGSFQSTININKEGQ